MNILLSGRASSKVNIEEGSFPHPGKATMSQNGQDRNQDLMIPWSLSIRARQEKTNFATE